jgi:hypothetical protein
VTELRYPLTAGPKNLEQGHDIKMDSFLPIPVAVLPLTGEEGQVYVLATDGLAYQWWNAAWRQFSGAAISNGTGTTYLASYGDSTPALIFTLPLGQALGSIDVGVTEVWNGVGASIQVGVVGEAGRYFDSSETELTEIATFSKDFSDLGPKLIIITINPGLSPSAGKVRIQISTTSSGT